MHKVFFAHPDAKIVALYESYLSPHFSFDSAHDGMSALRKIKLSSPSLIVSDYELPILSGLSLLKFIRSHPEMNKIPFLFFSDHPGEGLGLSHGANDWIYRQTTPESVLNKIYYHLKTNKINAI